MVSFPFIMNIALVAEELVWWIRVLTAFGEDPSLVHSPCMKQLTAACIAELGRLAPSSGLLVHLRLRANSCEWMHTCT